MESPKKLFQSMIPRMAECNCSITLACISRGTAIPAAIPMYSAIGQRLIHDFAADP